MQKPGLEKLWQLVGTLVHYRSTQIALQAKMAIATTALALPMLCLVASNRVAAQIKPDTTLPRNSIVTSRGNIIQIDGGTQAGSNLFHSFSQFSVLTGGTAFFNNAAGISNIFSRVTGGFVSNIDGILKANGTANLFLINPNGIIFGPNAQLNIGGSFVATTANAIQFGTQGVFSASVPNSPSLLTVNPSAFLFNQIAAQGTNSLENRGDLEVNPGKSLLLVGGNISPTASETGGILIDGMNSRINLNQNGGSDLELIPTGNGVLKAQGGAIGIGGLAAPGAIGLNIDTNNPDLMSLNFPSGISRVDVSLVNAAALYVAGGGGGSITINARNFNMSGGSVLDAGIVSQLGPSSVLAGDIIIDATNLISLDSSDISDDVSSQGVGNGGNITITGRTLKVTNGAVFGAGTFGQGNAGNLTISALDGISFDGEGKDGAYSGAVSAVAPGAVGNGGNLTITGRTIKVTNGAQLGAGTFGQGNSGNVTISALDGISFDGEAKEGYPSGAFSQVESRGVGNGGNLTITGRTISVTNGAVFGAGTYGQGNAGNLTISAIDGISFDGEDKEGSPSTANSAVEQGAVGNGGNLTIAGRTIKVTNGAQLNASTLGQGNSGNLTISALDGISFDGESKEVYPSGAFSRVAPGGVGSGGNLTIAGRTLSVTNGAVLSASTFGHGNAGNLTISARDGISFDGESKEGYSSDASSEVGPGAVGNGGNLTIAGRTISVTNGAQLSTGTFGQGNAGNLTISALDGISFDGKDKDGYSSGAFSRVDPGAVGNGGNLNITGRTISVTNGAELSASTFGHGNAGNVTISAIDGISFDGEGKDGHSSGAFSSVEPGAVGNGGNLNITGSTISVTNGAELSASTFGQGNAGNLNINVNTFNAAGGSSILTTTSTNNRAGDININAASQLTLSDSNTGIFASTDANSTGNGGNVSIAAPQLTIRNGAQITTSSQGTGNAGDILNIQANSLTLDNGSITTTSPSGNGGNINNIQVRDLLLLRNNSKISTSAGTQSSGGGNGGNITINAPFIVAPAVEKSDIIANAYQGNGGNIQINSQSLFGIKYSSSLISESDINASSKFGQSGIVQINTPTVNPTQGLLALPTQVVDASTMIAKNCSEAVGDNQFIITGRGGLPPNPDEVLSSDTVWEDTHSSATTANQQRIPAATTTKASAATARIISPATGWVFNDKGEIMLVATAPASSFYNPWLNATTCYAK